jgi:hypothetical protein
LRGPVLAERVAGPAFRDLQFGNHMIHTTPAA